MKIYFYKNNYIFTNTTLSWILVPIVAILYYSYELLRPIIYNSIICIALIGLVNTVRERRDEASYRPQRWQYYSTLLSHGVFLIIFKRL